LAVVTNGSVTAINLFGGGGGYSPNPTVTIDPPPAPFIQSLWSNDGSSVAGSEPTQAFSVPVSQGLYSVGLGDTSVPGMPQSIDPAVFALNADVRLRLWFSASGNPGSFQHLRPDHPIRSTGFALAAATADSATNATNADFATNAGSAGSANFATNATSAATADALAPGAGLNLTGAFNVGPNAGGNSSIRFGGLRTAYKFPI